MPTPTRPSARRTWFRRAAFGLLGLAILYLGTAFLLSRFLNPEELAAWVEPRLERTLGRDVSVGRAEVKFLPLGIRLQDLTLADPTGLAPQLASLASLELRVKLLPLLRREVQVKRLSLEGLDADLRISPAGRSNFGDLSTKPASGVDAEAIHSEPADPSAGTDPPPLALNLQGLRLVGGSIRYSDARDSLDLDLADIDLRASAARDPMGQWVFEGSTSGGLTASSGGELPLLERAPIELVFSVDADQHFQRLGIRTGEVRVGQVGLTLTGSINQLQDPVRTVSMAVKGEDIPLQDLIAVLPDSMRGRAQLQAEGLLAADLEIEGQVGPGHVPTITGTGSLTGGQISLRGNRIAENLTADMNLTPDWTALIRTQATVLNGPFSVEGSTTLGRDGSMDMALQASPDLGKLGLAVDLPEGVSASGQVESDLRITGPLGRLHDLSSRGNVQARRVSATLPSLAVPLEIPEGGLQLSGRSAIVRDLPIILGADRVLLSGEVGDVMAFLLPEETPRFNGTLQGPRLNLPALSVRQEPDLSLTYGRVAFAKVGDRTIAGRGAQVAAEELGLRRPTSLPMAGSIELDLDTIIDRQGRMENVRAQIDFGPSFLQVLDADFDRFGGRISTSVDLTLASDDAAPFSFSLQVRELDAGSFLAQTTPLGDFISGTISLNLDLIGTLDGVLLPDRPALVGSGSFTLSEGRLHTTALTRGIADFLGLESLREPAVQNWRGWVVVEQGWIRLSEATIQGAPGSPAVGGSVGLNGELDLRTAFSLPTNRLDPSVLERLGVAGDIAANVMQRPEVTQAILQIAGSLFDPAVEADPSATVQTLSQAVEEEVRAEAQERIDREKAEAERVMEEQQAEAQRRIQERKDQLRNRATGFFRDLVQPRDTMDTSTRPDTTSGPIPPDSILPDTVQPDTLGPDTIRVGPELPDSLRPDTLVPDTVRRPIRQPGSTRGSDEGRGSTF